MGCGGSTANGDGADKRKNNRVDVTSKEGSQASRAEQRRRAYEKPEVEFVLLKPTEGHAPSARKMHTAIAVQDHSLICFGGVSRTEKHDATEDLEASLNLKKVAICQQTYRVSVAPPHMAKWHSVSHSQSGEAPRPRATHRAVNVQGSMYIFGSNNKKCNDVYVYNIAFHQWRQLKVEGAKPRPTSGGSLSRCPKGTLVLFGGETDYGITNELWLFHIESQRWAQVPPTGPLVEGATSTSALRDKLMPRRDHTALVAGDLLLVYGGFAVQSEKLDFIQYNVKSRQWSLVSEGGEPPKKRGAHVAAAWGHYMVIFGGQRHGKFLNDIHVFDSLQGIWTPVSILATPTSFIPSPRAFAASSSIGNWMYVHGGGDDSHIFADFFRVNLRTIVCCVDPTVPTDGDEEPVQRSDAWSKLAVELSRGAVQLQSHVSS